MRTMYARPCSGADYADSITQEPSTYTVIYSTKKGYEDVDLSSVINDMDSHSASVGSQSGGVQDDERWSGERRER